MENDSKKFYVHSEINSMTINNTASTERFPRIVSNIISSHYDWLSQEVFNKFRESKATSKQKQTPEVFKRLFKFEFIKLWPTEDI